MKQLLFLLLFPCLALAQYQGNGSQKITLGEQTTADGLVYRGVASIDTVTATSKITRVNKLDTSAFLLLDTVTNLLWHYKTASNGWIQAGGSTLDTATMLLPYYRAGRNTIIQAADVPTLNQNTTGSAATLTTGRTIQTNLASTSAATFNGSANITPGVTGTLPVANGGTNTSTLTANKVMVGNGTSGVLTPTNLHWDNTNSRLGIGILNPTNPLEVLRKNNSWVSFKDTLAGGFFAISNGTGSSSITFPIFNIQGAGNFGSNLQYTSAFIAYKDSLSSENINDILWSFDARKRKSNPLGSNANITKVLSGATFYFGNYGDPQLVIKADDKVGIGTASPSVALHVVGNGRFTAVGAGTFGNNLNITSDGTLTTATSDEKYKYNILPINYGLNAILQLKPVNFQWVEGEENDLGFIAQDVADIIPEAVNTNWNSDLLMRYESLIPILTKAIQEQNALIKALEQRILILENK